MTIDIDTSEGTTESATIEVGASAGSRTVKIVPRAGGIETIEGKSQAWTGGGMLSEYKRQSPASNGTRPTDSRASKQTMFECMKALPETKHIDASTGTRAAGGATFISWVNAVERKMTFDGTDTVAYVLKLKPGVSTFPALNAPDLKDKVDELCLFSDWGKLDQDDIKEHCAAIAAHGCPYDRANNEWATAFLRASIGPNLLTRADFDLDKKATGTEYLYFILSKVQASSGVARYQLTDQLRALKLSQFKGNHVIECAQHITEIMTTLEGYGMALDSIIPFLVIQIFSTSPTGIVQFDTEVIAIEKDIDRAKGNWTWNKILAELQLIFDRLLMTNRWPLIVLPSPAAVGGYTVTVDPAKKKGDHSKLTCHGCGKQGHIRPNCPDAKKSGRDNDRTKPTDDRRKQSGGGAGSIHPSKIPPKAGDPHSKSIQWQGKTLDLKWCDKCKSWKSGRKAHLTADHTDSTARLEANVLQPSEGGLAFGPFAAGLFPSTNVDPVHAYLTDLYDRNTSKDDVGVSEGDDRTDPEVMLAPEVEIGWEWVAPGKGTPMAHAQMHPKDLAGRV